MAAPVAVSSYIMAKDMNSDHVLAGQLVVLTTVLCGFTLFAGIYLLRVLSLI
jgi:predicted permease